MHSNVATAAVDVTCSIIILITLTKTIQGELYKCNHRRFSYLLYYYA